MKETSEQSLDQDRLLSHNSANVWWPCFI